MSFDRRKHSSHIYERRKSLKSFFTSHDEKITEKVFSQSLLISVISILLCLVALCSMTYAWFTESTTSSENTLISGSFALDEPTIVQVAEGGISTVNASADIVILNENGVYSCTLPANGTYLVTLTCGASTAKGHCTVKINGCKKSTDVIIGAATVNKDVYTYTENDPFSFCIQTSTEAVTVEFDAAWGVVVSPDIKKDFTYRSVDWEESSDDLTTEPSP